MPIVNLGTRVIPVGGSPVAFDPFPFLRDRAYAVLFTITPANPNMIFSYLTVDLFLSLSIGVNLFYPTQYNLDILRSPRLLFFPMSPLLTSDGNIIIGVERRNLIRGGGDVGDVTITCLYDDAGDQPTWLPPQ